MGTPQEKVSLDAANPLGLDESELGVLQTQVDVPTSEDGYFAIYRYSTRQDLLVILGSTVMSIVSGASLPLMTVRPLRIS
jgi:ATP-binding cassette, subfamily B (MDR/TAP), member 1